MRSTLFFTAALALSAAACDGGELAAPRPAPSDSRDIDRADIRFSPVESGVDVWLRDVWGSGPDDIWIVGDRSESDGDRAASILRWRGDGVVTARVAEAAPEGEGEGWFAGLAVAGTGPDDVWLVGASRWDAPPVVHHDGAGWRYHPEPWCTYGVFWSVWPNSRVDVWAAGNYGGVWHWDGAAWHDRDTGGRDGISPYFRGAIEAIWSPGRGVAWVVGTGNAHSGIGRWDGEGWHFDLEQPGLLDIWGTAADDIWAVGHGGRIQRWNGERWQGVPSGTEVALRAVRGASADAVWAVGDGGTILFWDGETWAPVDSGTDQDLYGVWDAGSAVWAVGRGGTVVRHRF